MAKTTSTINKKLNEEKASGPITPDQPKISKVSEKKSNIKESAFKEGTQTQAPKIIPKRRSIADNVSENPLSSAYTQPTKMDITRHQETPRLKNQSVEHRNHKHWRTKEELEAENQLLKREVDLVKLAEQYGYKENQRLSSKNETIMLHKAYGKISVGKKNGHYVYSSYQDDGGGSAFDFIMKHQGKSQCDQEVYKELRSYLNGSTPNTSTKSHQKNDLKQEKSKEDLKENPVEIHRKMKSEFDRCRPVSSHRYLEKERKIGRDVLASDRFKDCIYVDHRSNAVFPQYAENHKLTAFEKRNTNFKGNSEGKGTKGLWVSKAFKSDRELVLTESPIDALSHHELKGMAKNDTRYIAFGGKMSEKQLKHIKIAINKMQEGSTITIATDHDKAGEKYYQQIKALASDKYVVKKDLSPTFDKDWNDELKQHKENRAILQKKIDTLTNASYQRFLGKDCKIHHTTLQDKRFQNCILVDDEHENAIFPQKNGLQVTNLEIYNERSKNKFYLTSDKEGLWKSNASKDDKRLVITSSPIEALSYHELQKKNNTGTRYIAISDNMSEKQKVLLKAEIKKVPEVEIATANNKHTEQIKSLTGFKEQSKADQHTHFKEFFKDHANTKDPSKEQAQKHVEKSSASEPVTLNSMLKKQKQRSKSMER